VVADPHNCGEEQDTDPHLNEKADPDTHYSPEMTREKVPAVLSVRFVAA
jgi:hypothetical protein